MLTRRRKWILGLSVGTAAIAIAVVGSTSVSAQSSTDWSLNSTQVAQARQALMLMATQSDPAQTGKGARVTGAWPSNITAGRVFGTDRAAANAAMGEAKAVPATDTRQVVCTEGRGEFSTAGIPRPPGSPVQTYTYVLVCFDPTTGNVLDTGYDNKPVTRTFASSQTLNITSAITSTVK